MCQSSTDRKTRGVLYGETLFFGCLTKRLFLINVELRSGEVLFLCVLLRTNVTSRCTCVQLRGVLRTSVCTFCTIFDSPRPESCLKRTNFTLAVPSYAFGQALMGSVREFCTTFSHSSMRAAKQHRPQKNAVFTYNYAYAYTQKRKNAYNIHEVKQNGYKRCYCSTIYGAMH